MSDPSSADRRRSHRFEVEGVRGSLTFRSEARIRNLSLTGMSVETADHLEVGKPYSIKLAHGEGEVRLSATVVRSRMLGTRKLPNGDSEPLYEVGMRFNDVLNDKAMELHGLLSASARISPERRVTGRFEVGLPESVRLDGDHQFEVRTISATGMLIETGLAPRLDSVIDVSVPLGDGEELRAAARVAYIEPVADAPDRHRLGLEFRDLTPEDRDRLESFIGSQLT